ncbi:MAG: zinc ribbon domain-containing protein [Patescibacteria group bacterium]|nr:zinc ribbon domain-containing protein [Patescibacteria group bacterium]
MTVNQKSKLLKTINQIRKRFLSDFTGKLSRTVCFRIYPKGQFKDRLDRWFNEISEIKFEHLQDIYERFKNGDIQIFKTDIKYSNLYKGRNLFSNLKERYPIISRGGSKIEEGIRQDVEGILKSFVSNTRRILEENKKILSKNQEVLEIIDDKNKILPLNLFNDLKKEYEENITFPFEKIEDWQIAKELTANLNNIISEINSSITFFNLNFKREDQQNATIKRTKRPKLNHLNLLPLFPLVDRYENIEKFKTRFNLTTAADLENIFLEYLRNFKSEYGIEENGLDSMGKNKSSNDIEKIVSRIIKNIDSKKLIHYLNEISSKYDFKTSKKRNSRKSTTKIRKFRERFFHWISSINLDEEKINDIFRGLLTRLYKEENHLFKRKFDAKSRNEYFNTLYTLAELVSVSSRDYKHQNETTFSINNKIANLKAVFQKGRPIKDTFTISGFSWGKSKPQKSACLFLREDNGKKSLGIVISRLQTVYNFRLSSSPNEDQKQFKFIVLRGGGSRKKNVNPKYMNFQEGILDITKDEYACWFKLYHGKSYLRRFIFHKKWGFLNDSKNGDRFYPANARLKRIKIKPGDPYEYYIDITFRYEGNVKKLELSDIKESIKYFIGIDRGEVTPICLAVIDQEGQVIRSENLGKEIVDRLKDLDKKKRKKNIRDKIKRTQETMLKQSIAKILNLLLEYPGILVIERLASKFGKEKSIIPLRMYSKIREFIFSILEFGGLAYKSRSRYGGRIRGLLLEVDPKDTSVICPECGFNFNDFRRENSLRGLGVNKFRELLNEGKIDLNNGTVMLKLNSKDKTIKIPQKWTIYRESSQYPEEVTLDKLKVAIERGEYDQDYNEAIRLFTSISPRISQSEFVCLDCGYKENADIVGAINIAKRGREYFMNILSGYKEENIPSHLNRTTASDS